MDKILAKFVSVLKSLAYLAVTVSVGYTYLNKDNLLEQLAEYSAPYNEVYVEESINNSIDYAVASALKNDTIKAYIDENQWRQLDDRLLNNKKEILAATPIIAKRIAEVELHDFLTIEREVVDPFNGNTYYVRGILLGLDDYGNDEWIYRISNVKTKEK